MARAETSLSDAGKLTDQVCRALRIAVEKMPGARLVEAASAAFHAEPLLRLLCEQFEDPVRSVAISDDNFVVIRINADDDRNSDARIVVSPRGEAAFRLHREGRSSGGFLDVHNDYPLPPSAVRKLTGFGIRGRREAD